MPETILFVKENAHTILQMSSQVHPGRDSNYLTKIDFNVYQIYRI